jgi:hypothetical protein
MSKVSHLNVSLNTNFFVTNISSANPYFLMRHFHCCHTGNAFWTSSNPMCHMFLILSYIYIFLSEPYLSIIPFSSCVSSITVSQAIPSTTSNTSSQTPSVNGRQPNNPTKQHLPWSGIASTLLPPCCQPLPP